MFIYAVTLPLEFVVGALLFYILIRKALNAESEKRVKEQSIIYAAIMHDLKTPIRQSAAGRDDSAGGTVKGA